MDNKIESLARIKGIKRNLVERHHFEFDLSVYAFALGSSDIVVPAA